MATTIYNRQIESFYRSVGEGDITVVNGATSSTLTKGAITNYIPKRWSLEEVYDLFWRSGGMINRALKLLDFNKAVKAIPSLLTLETVSLSSNVGNISGQYDFIYEESYVVKSGVNYRCRMIPFRELSEIFTLSSGQRKYPTLENPKFSLTSSKVITVYPISAGYTNINIKGISSVIRLVAATNNSDSWNVPLSDLLILITIMLAKGETNEDGIFQYALRNLQLEYNIIKQKPTLNNLIEVEEQK